MRRLEKRWLKYKNEGCLITFKKCHNSYYGKLNAKKKGVLCSNSKTVAMTPGNSHALMTNLTTKQNERQFPPAENDEDLAEEFATYFQNKILNIRDALNNKPHFTTEMDDVPKLRCFAPVMECTGS